MTEPTYQDARAVGQCPNRKDGHGPHTWCHTVRAGYQPDALLAPLSETHTLVYCPGREATE